VDTAVPWRVRDAALLLALSAGVLLLSVLGAQGLYRLQGAPATVPAQPPPVLAVLATDLFYVAILAGIWLLVVRRYGVSWAALGLRTPGEIGLYSGLLLAVGFVVGIAAVIAIPLLVLPQFGLPAQFVIVSDIPDPQDPLFVITLVGSLVLAPFAEELLFRGVLHQSLRKRLGVPAATCGSSALYAVLQMRPQLLPQLFILGVVLALAFERTRSLFPAIGLHAVYQAVIILLALGVI
jgi:membrane protease YdiL (CAAX protease family)